MSEPDYTDPKVLVPRNGPIDTDDVVLVTWKDGRQETLGVAYVDRQDGRFDRLSWVGWPPGELAIGFDAMVELVKEATDEQRTKLLHELADMRPEHREGHDRRRWMARERLGFNAKERAESEAAADRDAIFRLVRRAAALTAARAEGVESCQGLIRWLLERLHSELDDSVIGPQVFAEADARIRALAPTATREAGQS